MSEKDLLKKIGRESMGKLNIFIEQSSFTTLDQEKMKING
jgi:hypothetical protein